MHTVSRRQFLGKSAAAVAGAGYLAAGARQLGADPLGLPIGFQSYSVRNLIATDFEGALRQLAAVGYKTVEMCSPQGYERSGFGSLANMKGAEVRRIIEGAGLRCESSHYQFKELTENLPERIAWAKEVGIRQMVLASFGIRPDANMDAWRRAADELNKAGAEGRKAGVQIAFHNHNGEFREIDGVLIYDELLRRLDPQLVKMQFQVAVISLGFKAATYFNKYPGRFVSLHLADWSATDKKLVAVGQGSVDWTELFAAAPKGGVKNYFVEVNLDALKASYPYLHNLKV
jgi:sugar phosphate isomerase/epimerase